MRAVKAIMDQNPKQIQAKSKANQAKSNRNQIEAKSKSNQSQIESNPNQNLIEILMEILEKA